MIKLYLIKDSLNVGQMVILLMTFPVFEVSEYMKTGWKKYAVLQVNGTLGLNHVDLFGISTTVQEFFLFVSRSY